MEKNNRARYTGPERRKYKRLKVLHLSVPIVLKTNIEGLSIPGILLDISAGGIGILTFKEIPVNTVVNLQINLHYIKTDIIKAKVVWIKQLDKTYKAGLQFIEISKKDFEQISNYVDQHLMEDFYL
jgi:c-di-GMP-binding flagellar brake protein YcgR